METNILNVLTTNVINTYDNAKATANMFANQKMFKEAHTAAKWGITSACGAITYASLLAHESGYPDIAEEVLRKWNDVWNEWFTDLINDFPEEA